MESKNDAQVTSTGSTNIPVSPSTMFATDAEIQKYRKRLSSVFSCVLILGVVGLISEIIDISPDICSFQAGKTFTIITMVDSLLAFLTGLYFTRQYHPTCLRIFYCCLLIITVCTFAECIARLKQTLPVEYIRSPTNIAQTNSTNSTNRTNQFLCKMGDKVVMTIFIAIIDYAFKLAKRIENKRLDILQQV